ncbi:MAG: MSMEG_1061 family FMN-dependent PPOX-type flavoprotein [Aquabacterium sp.]
MTTVADLRARFAAPGERARLKQLDRLDRHCRRFIALSPFVVLATGAPGGPLDASPRGGAPGFVVVRDDTTLLIPDAPGNNRLDTLENLITQPRLGALFMIPGVDETLRINGDAELSVAADDIAACTTERRAPKLVIRVTVQEAYLHCAKALLRSKLWHHESRQPRSVLPTAGQMLIDQTGIVTAPETQEEMVRRYQADL